MCIPDSSASLTASFRPSRHASLCSPGSGYSWQGPARHKWDTGLTISFLLLGVVWRIQGLGVQLVAAPVKSYVSSFSATARRCMYGGCQPTVHFLTNTFLRHPSQLARDDILNWGMHRACTRSNIQHNGTTVEHQCTILLIGNVSLVSDPLFE